MTIVFIGAYLCPFFPVLLQHGARSDRLLAPAIAGFLLGLLLDVLVLGDLVQLLAIAILERMAGLAPALTASSRLLAELAARALRQPRDRALPPRRPLCLPGISLRGLYLARRSHSTHLHRFALWDLYPHGTGVTRWLALVCADELGPRQHVPLDRLLELGLRSAGAKLELRVERVQAEDVAVAPVARRRAGAAVAGRAEVVLALARRRLALAQPACSRIESPGGPVREDAARGIRVVDNERQRPRPLGHVRPAKRRRDILTLAAVAAGDRLCVVEAAALEAECVHQQVRCNAAAVRRGSSSP